MVCTPLGWKVGLENLSLWHNHNSFWAKNLLVVTSIVHNIKKNPHNFFFDTAVF